ncbi:MAG: hypothetical protein JRN15_12080 [Nitrososphaerota archaeon]|nr:hypothetical protein [Nitrososphaerota archaeon]
MSGKTPSPSSKASRPLSRAWFVVLVIGVALTLLFAILNLINSSYTFVQLVSMLFTTFPIILVVVIGVVFAFGGKRRSGQKST